MARRILATFSLWRAAGFLAAATVFTMPLAACGEGGLLDGVGDRSREAVYEGLTTTTEFVAGLDDDLGAVGAADSREVAWFNDSIEDQAVGATQLTISQVWNRGKTAGRFIQSSRAEIASALPQIQFPRLVPPDTVNITSQLVYDPSSGALDVDTAAAFGLWPVEPYTLDDGQQAVLRVGFDQGNIPPGEVVIDVVGLGLSLEWVRNGYRYELFCRESLDEALCSQMVDTMEPLATITPKE
jgi:hypothetical protein